MARRGVMTALQAALAGIGGAAGGYVQQQELERKRKIEEEARKRQEMLDIVGLQERGFMSPEQLAQQQMQGKRTTGAVVQNALLSALSPRAGVLPPPTAQDVGLASQALATAGRAPQRIVTAGGQEMFRLETPQQGAQRQELLKEERTRMGKMEERRYEQTFAADEARRRREERQEMTPYQKAQIGIAQQELKIRQAEERRRANQPAPVETAGAGSKAFSRDDVDFLMQFAPIEEQKDNKIVYKDPKDGLNSLDVQMARYNVTNWMAGANEQRYAAVAGAIADAKARASEKGVLTNQDIDRYRNSILIRPGDSIETKADKFRRMATWADELLGKSSVKTGMLNDPNDY